MKTYITKTTTFDMGHRLTRHKGKCYGLHGHTYHLEVTLSAEILTVEGFVIDFTDLKEILKNIIDQFFDHKLLLSDAFQNAQLFAGLQKLEDERLLNSVRFVNYEPTVENIANSIFKLIAEKIAELETAEERNLKVEKIKLFETPTSYAEIY